MYVNATRRDLDRDQALPVFGQGSGRLCRGKRGLIYVKQTGRRWDILVYGLRA